MPDLDIAAVTSWFAELHSGANDQGWPPAVRPVEARSDVAVRLSTLGRELDEVAFDARDDLFRALHQQPGRDVLQDVLAQLGAARLSRLIHWIGRHDCPEAAHLVSGLMTGESAETRAIRSVVTAVTRRVTLDRMFSPERLQALDAACASGLEEIL